jgi:uncharacterized protein (UPF0332 family)
MVQLPRRPDGEASAAVAGGRGARGRRGVERQIEARPDPELAEISGPFDPFEIAHEVADDLRRVYGDRLRRVLLFGSWARGDAHPESDIDLLVVLDRLDSPWEELADGRDPRPALDRERNGRRGDAGCRGAARRTGDPRPHLGYHRGSRDRVTRSRRELEAARFLAGGGFAEQAISRGYYAAFYAAEKALLALGETRSKHSGVLAAFEKLVVRDGGFDPAVGRLLRPCSAGGTKADYGAAPASQEAADAATGDAERVVEAVESWVTRRTS